MTAKEALKEIKDYFNLDLLPYSEQRLLRILEMLDKTKTVTKVKKVYVQMKRKIIQ